ncbi:MAG: hypothetical protein H6732_00275 [Alphaproteobacteria bacterium]|nr:hypothetical protein [Alphaproteobacteria bacterium]
MKSWTRTLNLDDAHTLLALAQPGRGVADWTAACHPALPGLSQARRRELVRILRDGYLELDRDRIAPGLFLRLYLKSPATAQLGLVQAQWALTHPLSRVAATTLVGPALASGRLDIPLQRVEDLVAAHLETRSQESLRKTRTVLLGALEGIGVLHTSGTGQHRALRAARGRPDPVTFAYLVLRELDERGVDAMLASEVLETGHAVQLTQCGEEHAARCLRGAVHRGLLVQIDDEVRRGPGSVA